jgi:hypothetical protein
MPLSSRVTPIAHRRGDSNEHCPDEDEDWDSACGCDCDCGCGSDGSCCCANVARGRTTRINLETCTQTWAWGRRHFWMDCMGRGTLPHDNRGPTPRQAQKCRAFCRMNNEEALARPALDRVKGGLPSVTGISHQMLYCGCIASSIPRLPPCSTVITFCTGLYPVRVISTT